MKALFLADLYQLRSNFKFYGVFLVVALGITASGGLGNSLDIFFPMYAIFLFSMVCITLLQMDEGSHWNICAQTLPCTRRDQVTEKYAVSLSCFGVIWVLFTLVYAVLALRGQLAWQMMALHVATLLIVGLLAPAFSLPTIFRWGSAKGRIVFLVMIILLAAALGGAAAGIAELDNIDLPEIPMPLLAALAVVVPIALFIGSWALSVKWYERREL